MRLLGEPTRVAMVLFTLVAACDDPESVLPGGSSGGLDGGFADPNSLAVGDPIDGLDPTLDTDMDGILDVVEGTVDTDGDGIPALRDPDERVMTNPPPGTTGNPVGMNDGGVEDSGPKYDGSCDVIESESQFERAPVDVIWAIDNSLSMGDDFPNVAAGLDAFTTSVASSGADMHVVMVSLFVTGLDQSIQADPKYNLRAVNVWSNDAFQQLLGDFPNYSSHLRPDAATHIIVVSDDISGMAQSEFRTQMEANLGQEFYFHAIVTGQGISTEYTDLVAATGGISQPITNDWTPIFDQLESAIVETATLPCDVPVSGAQGDLTNVQVLYTPTDGTQFPFPKADNADACGDAEAWHYDSNDAPSQVILCPAACDGVKQGGALDVVFACEPPPVLN